MAKADIRIPPNWRELPTVSIPVAGKIAADLSEQASYRAAKRGELPTITLGVRHAVPVAKLRRMLGELPDTLPVVADDRSPNGAGRKTDA
jgi:hypothetical protein